MNQDVLAVLRSLTWAVEWAIEGDAGSPERERAKSHVRDAYKFMARLDAGEGQDG